MMRLYHNKRIGGVDTPMYMYMIHSTMTDNTFYILGESADCVLMAASMFVAAIRQDEEAWEEFTEYCARYGVECEDDVSGRDYVAIGYYIDRF